MSDLEFDILDELYFVTPYQDLRAELGLQDAEMLPGLLSLREKGWLRVYAEKDSELEVSLQDLQINFAKYLYLASKKGLMAHNLGE